MKIDNDTSALFVKQNLFANGSAKKASNATGKELDDMLILNRNQTEQDIFGDSYSVELKGQKIDANPTHEVITFKGDYDWWASTPENAVARIENNIICVLSVKKGQASYTDYMSDLARSLNSYMSFQSDDYNPEGDSYMQSINERFDALDPEHQDSRINQIRSMIKTVQGGKTIHVDDEKFINEVHDSFFAVGENPIPSAKATTKKTYNPTNPDSAQSYQITMSQIQNSADLLAKLLNKDNDKHTSASLSDILHFDTDNQDTSDDITDKKRNLEHIQQNERTDSRENDDNEADVLDNKTRITAYDWTVASKEYSISNKNDTPLLYKLFNSNISTYDLNNAYKQLDS